MDEFIEKNLKKHLSALKELLEDVDKSAQLNDELAPQIKTIIIRQKLSEIEEILFNEISPEKD